MATCKDCIHYNLCRSISRIQLGWRGNSVHYVENVEEICKDFKARARFVELPYPIKPHDKVWYILEGLSEIDLKDYEITKGDCAVGNNPDTVIEVGTFGFWVNQLSERNEDYLVPDDCDFISWDEIGKSYFLTKEAAEQALKERGENENV